MADELADARSLRLEPAGLLGYLNRLVVLSHLEREVRGESLRNLQHDVVAHGGIEPARLDTDAIAPRNQRSRPENAFVVADHGDCRAGFLIENLHFCGGNR